MTRDRQLTLRVLDANANRAAEGLRVVEDYLRFILADRHLCEICKGLRHDLRSAIASLPLAERMGARDTLQDVGTEITAADEYHRPTPFDVWLANQKRVEQSLRCLEEFAKQVDPAIAAVFEGLRYRSYTLAKGIESTARNRERLQNARLYVLIEGAAHPAEFRFRAEALIGAGVHVLQLRDKRLADRELLQRARTLRELTRGTQTLFILNDRPDLAVLADADGVHVGQDELSVADARSLLGSKRIVGVSTHTLEQARQAVLDGADYLGCGPTFPSGTKSFGLFPGLAFLREVADEITLPAFAIGGIAAANVPGVLETGMRRIAVSGAISTAADPAAAVRHLLSLLTALDLSQAE